MKLAGQLPLMGELFLLLLIFRITKRTIAPDNRRITVKLEASMVFSPKANRHSTEFAAKAISVNPVNIMVFINK